MMMMTMMVVMMMLMMMTMMVLMMIVNGTRVKTQIALILLCNFLIMMTVFSILSLQCSLFSLVMMAQVTGLR